MTLESMKPTSFDKITDINIANEMRTSFLSYAMSVIVSRALPDVRDGLKPVHRRILYGMDVLGVTPSSAFKKSARIVGDVMGKYHPHGDSAIYDAMVRMAQDFSYRYPLVNGHGNFGSIDGDGAAAMRYTEAKMTKISQEMLRDLHKNTVDFQENYDGTESEPTALPSKFPNLLLNGATGIAVGMATNIPPHNLGEVIDGILAYIDDPQITLDGLMEYIKGPDFPTGGTIMGLSGVRQAYETGNGSFKIRAKSSIEEHPSGKKTIMVTEIPYQVNKTRLIEKIAELAKEKRIEGITDLRDESNRDGIKIIIELRKDVSAEVTLNNLYKFTPLQTSFGINMLALVNNTPKVLPLKDTIQHYVNHQIDVLTRRSQFDLEKARARAHILEGLLVALGDIDRVIEVIKNAYDDAEPQLMDTFDLSEAQAKAILEMRLRKLSGLEREKINDELESLNAKISELEAILVSDEKKLEVIREDLKTIKDTYNNPRLSEISLSMDLDLEDEDLIPREDVIITITKGGYTKRMNAETYKTQNRGGKGVRGMRMNDEDSVEHIIFTCTHDYLLCFSNEGRVYKTKAYRVPEFSRTSKGLPLVNFLQMGEGESLQAVSRINDFEGDDTFVFVTTQGIVKRTPVNAYQNIRTSGIRAINLREGDELHDVKLTNGENDIIIGTTNGKAIRFNETDVRPMGRTASGVKGIELTGDNQVIGAAIVDAQNHEILIVTDQGYGKRTPSDEYRQQARGGKGVKTLNMTDKNGRLVRLSSVSGDEDLIILSDKGTMIRIPVAQIAQSSRATQGVRLMRLDETQHVVATALVPYEEMVEEDADNGDIPFQAESHNVETVSTEEDAVGPEETKGDHPSSEDPQENESDNASEDEESEDAPQLNLFDES